MKNKTILVVDDSEFDRELLVRSLSAKSGYQLLQASGGEECLKLLSDCKIDLILMDIMMPGDLGSNILKKIRVKFNPIELPIIMVTSKNEDNDVIECLQNGANDYITKPVNFGVAMTRIETHLMLAETSVAMAKLKEIAALDAMIVTYHHEINNPLTIALTCLNEPVLKMEDNLEILKSSLWRVADIVKKIKAVSEKKEIEYDVYTGMSKMVKIR